MVSPGPVPHVGGPILPPAAIKVLIGNLPAARITDKAICVGPIDCISAGSMTVIIQGMPSARIADSSVHGGVIVAGFPTVLIGDSGGATATQIGNFDVVPDGTPDPLKPNQIRESDLKKALAVFNKIKDGKSCIKLGGDAEFQAATLANIAYLMSRPNGRALVMGLDATGKETKILESKTGKNGMELLISDEPKSWPKGGGPGGVGTGEGAPSTIYFNPDKTKLSSNEDWSERPPAIGLGHELIHAEDVATGTTDHRKNTAYTDLDGTPRVASHADELQAVGLGGYENDGVTENSLREEHGEPPRTRY